MKRGGPGWHHHGMRAMSVVVCLAAAAAVGACAFDPEVEVSNSFLAGNPCPPNGCGDPNSPVIDGVYFWRLHRLGLPNPEHVRIIAVQHQGAPMTLEVVGGDRLRGWKTSPVPVEHADLIGTRIVVTVPIEGQIKTYEITITAVAPTGPGGLAAPKEWFWVDTGPEYPTPIEAYDFRYRRIAPDLEREPRPLCAEGDNDPNKLSALVFSGDIYDPVTKEIYVGLETANWFNIACVDSAIYKMHKIGYTAAAGAKPKIPTTKVKQRRAMLNAWTSNVCGTGEAYTVPGEMITLQESLDLLHPTSGYLDEPATYEAIWDENGAVCLDVHRLEGGPDEVAIPCRAALQRCTDLVGDWTSHGHVLTGNPPPPQILVPAP